MMTAKELRYKDVNLDTKKLIKRRNLICPVCQFKTTSYWSMLVHYEQSKHDEQVKYLKK